MQEKWYTVETDKGSSATWGVLVFIGLIILAWLLFFGL